MATIKFFIKYKDREKSPIRAIVSFKKQYPISTGITIPTKYWNAEKYRCREVREFPDAKHFNSILDEWEKRLKDVVKSFEAKMSIPSQAQFKKAVNAAFNKCGDNENDRKTYLLSFARYYTDNCGKSSHATGGYETMIKRLTLYEKKMGKIAFSDISKEMVDSVKNFLSNRTYVKKGVKLKYAKNTVANTMKDFRFFINESGRNEYHNKSAKNILSVEQEVSDSIYLTVKELIKIHQLEITPELMAKLGIKGSTPKKINALIDNRDRFMIGAFTAMRYGDYSGIENLKYTNKYITKRTNKTGVKVIIPMHWVIKEILERRNNVLPKRIANGTLNTALKKLGQLANLTEEVEVTITRGGKQETTRQPKYELISTHTARRSGCTNMYLAGIDIYVIMGFSGHKTEDSFRKYIKIKQEENAMRFVDHPFFKKDGKV